MFFGITGILVSQTNLPPDVNASGREAYCPLSQINIATDFTISDPDDTGIEAFFIQISSGYSAGVDQLILTGTHPTINASWNSTEGKLTLRPTSSAEILYTDLEVAVRDVVYESSDVLVSGEKFFSFNIGDANFLPSTNHFYEYVPDLGIHWDAARDAAAARTYFGLQGYLATVTNVDEAQLTGEQASGAGWIGGSDAEVEGVWRWVTGPEAGTIFWNGGIGGSSPNFAFWNDNEPNNLGEEHYAHVTDPSIGIAGSWNDLANEGVASGPYQPKGYVVEYGGTPGDPVLNISASTSVYIPQILNTTNGEICLSGSTTLAATPSEGDILWYDELTGGTLLATGNTFSTPVLITSTTYYVAVSVDGCLTVPRTPVEAIVNELPTVTSTTDDLVCIGTEGVISANVSHGEILWFDSLTSTTPIFTGNVFTTPELFTTTIYYVEASIAGCVSSTRVPVTVTVDDQIPAFDLPETGILCLDIGSLLVEIANPAATYMYEWRNEVGDLIGSGMTLNVTEVGTYSVIATSLAGCVSDSKTIVVSQSEIANFTVDNIEINDITTNNFININPDNLGIGDYEFALDDANGPYQTNTTFQNITPGLHTLFIRDNGGCGIASYQFSVLDYPLFFTPNNDGENDVWQLTGIDASFYTVSEISIFNRFGILVAKLNADSPGWNGFSKGWKLPSSDYWFFAKLIDINGFIIERKGHFSLLRR